LLMAASESAIVAGEGQPHRQCRMAASAAHRGGAQRELGATAPHFGTTGFRVSLCPYRAAGDEKKRMSREGPRSEDQAFEIELIFG